MFPPGGLTQQRSERLDPCCAERPTVPNRLQAERLTAAGSDALSWRRLDILSALLAVPRSRLAQKGCCLQRKTGTFSLAEMRPLSENSKKKIHLLNCWKDGAAGPTKIARQSLARKARGPPQPKESGFLV